MDNRDIFEVQADFTLDILKHNLRMLASSVGQPKFPRFVRKMRAQLEQFLVLIETFEEELLKDSEKESDEELAHSAELLEINCQLEDGDDEDDNEWIRLEYDEHQALIKELHEEEMEFYTSTRFRCKVLRIKVRLLITKLNQFEATVLQTSPLT